MKENSFEMRHWLLRGQNAQKCLGWQEIIAFRRGPGISLKEYITLDRYASRGSFCFLTSFYFLSWLGSLNLFKARTKHNPATFKHICISPFSLMLQPDSFPGSLFFPCPENWEKTLETRLKSPQVFQKKMWLKSSERAGTLGRVKRRRPVWWSFPLLLVPNPAIKVFSSKDYLSPIFP